MKIVNLNVGIKIPNTGRIIAFLKEQDADIIVLQETTQALEDTVFPEYRSHTDIASALHDTHVYQFFGPVWTSKAFRVHGKIEKDFGGFITQGLSVFSKYPFSGGSHEFYYGHYGIVLDWSNWREEDHGRAVQIAHFNVEGKPFQVLNVHGIWTADKRGDERTLAQCRYLVEAASRYNVPSIICGDFNLLPNSASMAIIDKEFRNLVAEQAVSHTRPEFTDELEQGKNTVDYVCVGQEFQVRDFKVVDTDISDHLPLIVDLAFL